MERKIANTCTKQGDYDQALIFLAAALRHVQRGSGAGQEVEQARICDDLGWLYFRRGDLEHARNWLENGLTLAELAGHEQIVGSLNDHLGGVFFRQGNRPAWH